MLEVSGDIVFAVYDADKLCKPFTNEFDSTKSLEKGYKVTSIRPGIEKNVLICKNSFSGYEEQRNAFEKTARIFCQNQECIRGIIREYEEVSLTLQLRSDSAQIGALIPKEFIRTVNDLELDIDVDIISSGMVE